MTTLDLFWTCAKENSDHLDKHKLPIFLKALKDTKLSLSLQNIHVCEEDFSKYDLKFFFEKENLFYNFIVDNELKELTN